MISDRGTSVPLVLWLAAKAVYPESAATIAKRCFYVSEERPYTRAHPTTGPCPTWATHVVEYRHSARLK